LETASFKIAPPAPAGQSWSDAELEAEISKLRHVLQTWIERNDLWFDCGFKDYLSHVNGEPSDPPVVTLFWFEGPMHSVLSGEAPEGLEPQFRNLLKDTGYYYENLDSVTIAIYPEDSQLEEAFRSYFHWQWVCGLINEDTADVYHELYEQFARRPEDLQRISPRDFEILLFRIFQNQGFEAVPGPGRGDEGVDIRLLQRAPLGDVMTLVQAKRYAPHRKIGQTEVAALYGVGQLERADKALFVTTSTYAPVSKRWAARTDGYLDLAAGEQVVEWCARASAGVIADKASLVSAQHVMRLISEVADRVDPRIVHASGGWNRTDNWFALVLKETKHAALLMNLQSVVLNHDGYGQRGTHIPKLDAATISMFSRENVFRVKKIIGSDRINYWDGRHVYGIWDGSPREFDYYD
jgi:hypothetical protein